MSSKNQITSDALVEWLNDAKDAENIFNKCDDKKKDLQLFHRLRSEKPELFDLSPAALEKQISTLATPKAEK
jgi:hypothetical protein